eukprot:6056289-Prorocentrum_lima.AAC.1
MSECEEPSEVLLQDPSHDDNPPRIHNTKPSLNEATPVYGTELADKAWHRIWLVNDTDGELQDAVSEIFTNQEVMVEHKVLFHNTAEGPTLARC